LNSTALAHSRGPGQAAGTLLKNKEVTNARVQLHQKHKTLQCELGMVR